LIQPDKIVKHVQFKSKTKQWQAKSTANNSEGFSRKSPKSRVFQPSFTAENLNVANEIGLAHGANCPTFLVIRDGVTPPSNLADLIILRYVPGSRGWPQDDIARLARFIRVHWRAYVQSISDESLIHATAHRLLQMLIAVGHPVPNSIRALARVKGPSGKTGGDNP
jgi:hypothetical protein